MNCGCIKDIETRLVGREYKGKKILKAECIDRALVIVEKDGKSAFETITNSEFELEVEGMKRVQKQSMLHSYCPWCGTKIERGSIDKPEGKEAADGKG